MKVNKPVNVYVGALIVATTLCLPLVHCAHGDADQAGSADQNNRVGTGVLPTAADGERMAAVIQALSAEEMGGRLTGTPSGDRAEEYLVDYLEETGIEVATQEVVFPLFEVASPAALAVVDESGTPVDEYTYLEEFREVDYSGSGTVTGDLLFVGYGIETDGYHSYEGLDARGAVVAVLTGIPGGQGLDEREDGRLDRKIHAAHEQGAVGVLFILAGRAAQSGQRTPLETELRAQDSQRAIHPELLHEEMPVAFVQLAATERLLGKSAAALAQDPTPYAAEKRVFLEIRGTTHPAATCRNVFGILRGEDPEVGQEVVLLGAHYDHLGIDAAGRYYPGAADNATGTSVVLEAARAFQASGLPPRRTLVFALWCAEEQGLYGSVHYAYNEPLFPLADTRLMVQVDYLGEKDGPYLTNVDDQEIIQRFLGEATESPELPIKVLDYGGQCASDDCPFLWKKIPAYRFLAFGDHHHVHSDTFEYVNMPLVTRVGDVVIQGLAAVAY